MPRKPRVAPGGIIYHVFNRSAGRTKLFRNDRDYLAFQRIMLEAIERHPVRLLAYCLLEDQWRFVVWPREDGELSAFFRWLTHTHAIRWRVAHHTVGYGHLYGGRFKNFPIQRDEHLLTICRYVERMPLSEGMVKRAEDYRWSSLYAREHGDESIRAALSEWPVPRPTDWPRQVNQPPSKTELLKIETSLARSRPFGSDKWIAATVARLDLQHTLRRVGRPSRKNA